MNNLGKAIGLILFMGIILTSCLLLVSKPKDQVVTVTEFPQDQKGHAGVSNLNLGELKKVLKKLEDRK